VPVDSNLKSFISRWVTSGAAERANYQIFLCELCDVIGVPRPEPAKADSSQNAYVFEHPVLFDDGFGHTTTKFIDLYRRGAFILEAKQGSDKEAREDATGLKLPKKARKGTAVRGTQGWDDAMLAARGQAELYAKALPVSEGWPPFLVVVDVGHSIELFADFSRSGKTYVAFPDALTHRIRLEDLADEAVRERLRLVWTEPLELDPSRRSAKVTRKVAEQLADLAKSLERSNHKPEVVAQFLMRCIFTMFAEDVELLPRDSFKTLLEGRRGKLATFPDMLGSLWATMDKGGFSPILERKVLQFNGQLFADSTALPLSDAQLELLIEAAKSDWKAVEPAIFGTLLERALDPVERHKLGAHYTPRAYVERLVIPTIVEPLREQWSAVQTAAVTLAKANKLEDAREQVREFLQRLCSVTVLDPACGSGNFLYVTLEHLKRLEGEVRDALRGFGEKQEVFEGVGLTVDPHQLLGIELNPRAAAIAELVLWIGYLQWHFRTFGNRMPAEPVIKAFRNIESRDAVLTYDKADQVLDEAGKPVTRWDGRTMKTHLVTGEEVPDETAQVPVLRYINPKKAKWPEADFVIGNPPYIGNKRMKTLLGYGYVDALREAWAEVPESVDYVMYWWDHAASLVNSNVLRQFGFITTNSIVQTFNRRTVQAWLENNVSVAFAVSDHPWVDSADGAAVRVAMTVGTLGHQQGRLLTVEDEIASDGEAVTVTLNELYGLINSDLTIGVDFSTVSKLRANRGLACPGVQLSGQGFVISQEDQKSFSAATRKALIKPFLIGNDLLKVSRRALIIDAFGLEEKELRDIYPDAYQWLLHRVKPERDHNPRDSYRRRWWIYSEPRAKFRLALAGLRQTIAVCRTAKHRAFTLVSGETVAETTVVLFALNDPFYLGLLSSRVHNTWVVLGGKATLEDRPRYNVSVCFDTFPFPICDSEQRSLIGNLAERIDKHRRTQQAEHAGLTLTGIYNVLEKLRCDVPLSDKERLIHEQGLVSVLKQLHDELDSAVFDAYGWPSNLTDEEILTRLVTLNGERAAEETQGTIRWLRPDFQNPTGRKAVTQGTLIEDTEEPEEKTSKKTKLPWPKTLPERAQAVKAALAAQRTPVSPEQLAKTFLRARVDGVQELLETLASLGQARELDDGRFVAPKTGR
jgi:hypothetical protein